MKQRVVTGFLFTIGILAFVIPGYFSRFILAGLWAIVAMMITYELIGCVKAKGISAGQYLSYFGAAFSIIPILVKIFSDSALLAVSSYTMAILLLAMMSTILLALLKPGEHGFVDGIATTGIQLYVSFPLACANIMLFFIPKGWFFVVMGLFAPWVSDVFAYFTGSLLGRHKIVPHISPKKTWEGCIGGALGCGAVMMLYFWLIMDKVMDFGLELPQLLVGAAITGIILSIFSQLGDWMASSIKRWAGIKDFGNLLPGHGGLLDRFDSVFFTFPVTMLIAFFFI